MDASSPEAKLGSIQGQVIASEVRSIHLAPVWTGGLTSPGCPATKARGICEP
jgi:hypothetical protein